MDNHYSKNASQEMKEFDKRMQEINKEFLRLTPEQLDSWDPEDDYIPELDDVKAIKNTGNIPTEFFDDDLEWKEDSSLGIDSSIEDEDSLLNIDIESDGE